jgi:hypothetical protein
MKSKNARTSNNNVKTEQVGIFIIVVPWNSNITAAASRKPDKAPQTQQLAVQTTAYNKSKANDVRPDHTCYRCGDNNPNNGVQRVQS